MPNRSLWRPGYKFVVSAYHYMMVLHKVVSKVMALWLVWIVCTLHSWCHKIPSAIYVHSLIPNLAFYSSRQEQLNFITCVTAHCLCYSKQFIACVTANNSLPVLQLIACVTANNLLPVLQKTIHCLCYSKQFIPYVTI